MDINRDNYETFLLLYLDRELNPAEKQAVEKFLGENIDLQKEFTQLQQTIFTRDEIVFEPKELLFREEEKRRILPLYWIRVAASIVVVLTAGWFVFTGITKRHVDKMKEVQQSSVLNNHSGKDAVNDKQKNNNQTKPDNSSIVKNNKQTALAVVNASADNKKSGETFISKKGLQKRSNVSGYEKANLAEDKKDDHEVAVTEASDESLSSARKSSAVLEIQNENRLTTGDSKPPLVMNGTITPAMTVIPVVGKGLTQQQNADLKESDYQTDNAISVIALDDRNKSITGFFRKLTKTNLDNNKTTNTRKVHVSVFQFSY